MRALPLLLASLTALLLAPVVLRALGQAGHRRANYRERELPFPLGILVLAAATLTLIPVLLVERLADVEVVYPGLFAVSLYGLGVACLGLVDDAYGSTGASRAGAGAREGSAANAEENASASPADEGSDRPPPRGWRGHARAVRRGELSTGALKAGGSLGLALLLTNYREPSTGRWLLASAVLVLATNLFNLLDLRPGRTTKAFVVLGAGLSIGAGELRTLWTLGLFAGPALVAGVYDLRERAMLGDTGANLIGALAGLWLVLTLSTTGQAIAALLLAIITVYGEFRSISALVEKTPGLRRLDSLGRPS